MKFKFCDRVKILSGFYEGLEGNIRNFESEKICVKNADDSYSIFHTNIQYLINYSNGNCSNIWVDENELEKLED